MRHGDEVVASRRIAERGFNGRGVHEHARKGERGEIVDVFGDGWIMVRWRRTGTACQVHADEVSPRVSE